MPRRQYGLGKHMTIIRWLLISGVCAYVLIVGVLYVFQRSLLYYPTATRISPAEAKMPEAQEVVLATSDGEKLIAWHVPPRGDKPVVIYFHGNGEIVAWGAWRHRATVADGTGLIALNFRGYGGSTGTPSEVGLHRDAQAAYAFAAERYAPRRIVLWGVSLGTGVAVRLASERPVGKVTLESPYSSVAEVAASKFPWVPVQWLIKDPLRSDERIGAVHVPLLVMHGALDDVVPIRFGERLFALANEPKRFIRYDKAGHNDLDAHGSSAAARAFIAE
jgi:fermentation-respiration switch protein FrsA (DUF1100 family)